jgi:hypothetical protein
MSRYEESTAYLIADLERKPEGWQIASEQLGSEFIALRSLVAIVAPNFVLPGEVAPLGQIAQELSEWHRELLLQCSETYNYLTASSDGPKLAREEANADRRLQTLQSIKQGVKAAMISYYRGARGVRVSGVPKIR